MKKPLIKLISILFLSLFTVFANAQTFYVRSGAAGSNNGSDWNNAYQNLPTSLTRGAVYYIAGGTYGGRTFDDAASGSKTITIKHASQNEHGTDIGWNTTYGASPSIWNWFAVLKPYYIFDGSIRNSDWKSGYGIKIKSTAKNAIDLYWGNSSTASNVVIKYVEIEGQGLDNSVHDRGIYAVWFTYNLTIQNCYFHDFGGPPIMSGFSKNWLLEYSVIARNSSDPVEHAEGWAGTADSNIIIRYNLWEDIEGTGFFVELNRGAGANTCENIEIYGNVFMYTEGNPYNREGVGDGVVACINQQVAKNWKIYNNTIINLDYSYTSRIRIGGDGQTGNSDVFVYNNFWWGCAKPADHVLNNCLNCEIKGNRYDATTHANGTDDEVNSLANISTFVGYNNKDFHLTTPTKNGLILLSPYNIDLNGKVRGLDGIWDRGAYEFDGVIVTNQPPPIVTNTVPNITNTPPVVTNMPTTTNSSLPVVTLASPLNNSVFTNNSNILLSANASDLGGSITNVEFYNGASRIGFKTSAPYSITWNNVSQGVYRIFAKAYDDAGNSSVAGPNQVTVTNFIAPPINGCTNTVYVTNTITLPPTLITNFVDRFITNFIDKYITNTITIVQPPIFITNNIPVPYIPDISTTTSTLDKTNNTLDVLIRFKQ